MRLLLYLTGFLYYGRWLDCRDDLALGSSRLQLVVQRIGRVDFIICFWLLIMRGLRRSLIFLVVREDDDLAGLLLELPAHLHCFPLSLKYCLCSFSDAGLRGEVICVLWVLGLVEAEEGFRWWWIHHWKGWIGVRWHRHAGRRIKMFAFGA